MPGFRTSAHEESQLLDMVQQYWDPSAGGPSWKAIGLLLGCTAGIARHRWNDNSTEVLTPKAKAAAEAAGKAAAKQRVEERHEIVLRERSAGATWVEAAAEAPNLNGDGGRGTGAALQQYSPIIVPVCEGSARMHSAICAAGAELNCCTRSAARPAAAAAARQLQQLQCSFSDVTLRTSLALGSGPMQRGSPERARAPSGRPS